MGSSEKPLPVRHEFVYLVLSHGDPAQAIRLLRTLRAGSPDAALFVHHDAKGTTPSAEALGAIDAMLVEPRIPVWWGTFSQVDAILAGLRMALASVDFRWLLLLSGQDYPIRPLWLVERDLRESPYDLFAHAQPAAGGQYASRYHMQYWALPRIPLLHRLPPRANRLLNKARGAINARNGLVRIEPRPRGLPTLIGLRPVSHPFSPRFICHKGSTWMNLSPRAVRRLIEFGEQQPEIVAYFRRTLIPDESYIQSVLFSTPDLRICNHHRRFTAWDDARASHPQTITLTHFDQLLSPGNDFARKFDPAVDSKILDALDDIVLRPAGPTASGGPSAGRAGDAI